MKLRIVICTLFLLVSAIPMSGQAQGKRGWNRFSLDPSFGSNQVIGSLLGVDKSITEHPNSLNGSMESLRLGVQATPHWSFGIQLMQNIASGNGPWARNSAGDLPETDGVQGVATGRTDWKVQGLMLDIQETFLPNGRIHPYWRAGIGTGKLTVRFNGVFNGCFTEAIEPNGNCDAPIKEPASDTFKKIIPLFGAEAGIEVDVVRHFSFFSGAYWNTGWGTKIGLRIKF
jgi:hypothetical protein